MTKRIFDLLFVFLALPLVAPLILLVALAVRLRLGSPILFSQMRGGYRGRRFRLWKFRSMTDARDAAGNLLPDADRLTRFGSFLRSSSLDELPCLWNVVRGDMSIVGPRPFIADYLQLYSPAQARRHDVKPGITGWAQVSGRNAISWEEKFALDLWYVDRASLALDIRILWLTVRKVLMREGISQEGDATMPRFTGSPPQARPLYGIFGASGCGRGILPLARAQLAGAEHELVFVDDGDVGPEVNGHRVLSFAAFVATPAPERRIAIAIADPHVRRRIAARCEEAGIGFFEVRAAGVVEMDDVAIGEGALISPFVVFTSNIRVGRHFHANLHSIIEHDCEIGDFVTFAPGVRCNGNVTIGDGAYIGAGAMIRQGKPGAKLSIGPGAVVGMGAVVTRDVAAGTVVAGNPARPLQPAARARLA